MKRRLALCVMHDAVAKPEVARYLRLGRDREDAGYLEATRGRMLYAVPGVRVYWDKASFALGCKKPVWTRLNESELQQGAEGREKYRIIFSASYLS